MFYIVVYDVPSDKPGNRRRRRIVDILEQHLVRVQKSVFEGHLKGAEFRSMMARIRQEADARQDSVRVYGLRKNAMKGIRVIGFPPVTVERSFYHAG